ncbi:MAG: transcription elongation factor GreB [Rhodospirillaceae bacterium]
MSKAFVNEDAQTELDPEDLLDDELSPGSGGRILITPEGHDRLQVELKHLRTVERPEVVETVSWAASNGDRSENGDYIYGKKRLREIDRRMRHLMKRLERAEVVDPAHQTNRDRVFFGARVTYETKDGREKTVRIVGEDEARLELGEITWVSPMARALMGKEVGEVTQVRTPKGLDEVEIVGIAYDG